MRLRTYHRGLAGPGEPAAENIAPPAYRHGIDRASRIVGDRIAECHDHRSRRLAQHIEARKQGPMVRHANGGKSGLREIAGRGYRGLVTGGAMYRVQFHGTWKLDRKLDHLESINQKIHRNADKHSPRWHHRPGPDVQADWQASFAPEHDTATTNNQSS